MSTSQRSKYELVQLLGKGPRHEVYQAYETSLGAPCVIHRLEVGRVPNPSERQTLLSVVNRYARFDHPRVPHLMDAWLEETSVVAVEARPAAVPFDTGAANPFRGSLRSRPEEVFETSLQILSGLHHVGAYHCSLTFTCFGIGPMDRIYLLDSGIDNALVKQLQGLEVDGLYDLSTNLFAVDLADWAFHFTTAFSGVAPVASTLTEKWDDMHFEEAEANLRKCYTKPDLRTFFLNCLKGYGTRQVVFDSALDAFKVWQERHLGSLLR